MGSKGIGTQRSLYDKKFSHTARSFLVFESRVEEPVFNASARDTFRLYLKVLRKGHMDEMKLSLPDTDWICRRVA
jgi:hypothetical protein